MFHRVSTGAALFVILGLATGVASAQETRAEMLEQERAAKAQALATYEPVKLERWMLWFEDVQPLAKLAPHNGFYARYGFQWRPTGSGLGMGIGFRHDLFNRTARVDLGAGITMKNYQMLQADFSLPYLAGDRLEVGAFAVYRNNPQEDFWGVGGDSLPDNRVSFGVDYRDYQARVVGRPLPWLRAAARAGLIQNTLEPGTDKRFPSIEQLFSDETAPGLVRQPDFSYTELQGAIDYRDQEGNARAGGYYSVTWRRYRDRDFDHYTFSQTDAHVQQFFPIFDKKRVFAVQARLLSTNHAPGQQVPFYFKPTVGGSKSLRSFGDYRFRDDYAAYLNAEYRWEAFSGLDMALFADWGTVAPRFDALSLSNVKNAYGIGFRFNTYKTVFLRFDIGLGGDEGTKYFLKMSKAF